jgi:calcineurin-like phosphoesterase family protein
MKFLFYQPLKVGAADHQILFWSDTHFNHRCTHWDVPLWKARGFDSVEEHNEALIARWNEKSTNDSIFFHLGDFVFGLNSIDYFKHVVSRTNFKDLYVMPGNHNSGWKQLFEQQRGNIWRVSENKRVIFVPNYLEAVINGQAVVMSHYPILSFNGQAKHSIHVYGHVHGNLARNDIGKLYSRARAMEVTIENSPVPMSFGELRSRFKNVDAVSFDHHRRDA